MTYSQLGVCVDHDFGIAASHGIGGGWDHKQCLMNS
jgi:hypothetical protein